MNIGNLRKRCLPCSKPQQFGTFVTNLFFCFVFLLFIYCLFRRISRAAPKPRAKLPEPSGSLFFRSSSFPRTQIRINFGLERGRRERDREAASSHAKFSRDLCATVRCLPLFFLHFCYRIHATVGVVASVCIYVYVKKNESASVLQNAGRETLTLMYVQSPRKVLSEGGI